MCERRPRRSLCLRVRAWSFLDDGWGWMVCCSWFRRPLRFPVHRCYLFAIHTLDVADAVGAAAAVAAIFMPKACAVCRYVLPVPYALYILRSCPTSSSAVVHLLYFFRLFQCVLSPYIVATSPPMCCSSLYSGSLVSVLEGIIDVCSSLRRSVTCMTP